MKRKPKKPIFFSLGELTVQIQFEVGYANKHGADGRCYLDRGLIILDDDLEGFALLETLIHEARHAHHVSTGLYEILGEQAQEMDCQTTTRFVFKMIEVLNQLADGKVSKA